MGGSNSSLVCCKETECSAERKEVTHQLPNGLVKQPAQFAVQFSRGEGSGLGFALRPSLKSGSELVVSGVGPGVGTGLVGEWNMQNPNRHVGDGAVVLEVNGISKDHNTMLGQFRTSKTVQLVLKPGE
mmetsp:Transcript_14340/g.41197  ORF Transcript_14340/g.41197 Transcript_14340/m.41197 type:complete len:128 (-) Transcript_14340:110-493(-)